MRLKCSVRLFVFFFGPPPLWRPQLPVKALPLRSAVAVAASAACNAPHAASSPSGSPIL